MVRLQLNIMHLLEWNKLDPFFSVAYEVWMFNKARLHLDIYSRGPNWIGLTSEREYAHAPNRL